MHWRLPMAAALLIARFLDGGPAMTAEMPPGGEREATVHARLEAAYTAKGADYVPRTHLMEGDRARFVNRLIEEVSPYLLQHAHNPVDWHPWSDETLAKAARLGKPIFLSVGYATCHWCHVMEEESFDNVEVAKAMNRWFIPVKVDREQMPALDHIYITATQLQQGHAGWPNSVFLMPDGRPFHTGTYFPRDAFLQVVAGIGQAWASGQRRDEIEAIAGQLSDAVQRVTRMAGARAVALDAAVMARAVDALAGMLNELQGGFSQTQQFPQEGFLLFLLDHWRRTGEARALEMVETTLAAIVAGGLHDHAGGGFHRYTVDPNWRTPHFEKMLYNQALLGRALVETWEITGDPGLRRAAERAFAYLARDMTDADGAFYAAEDADSLDEAGRREEGAYYLWTPTELTEAVGETAVAALGIDQPPTLEAGAVIHFDPDQGLDFSAHDALLEAVRRARESRARPIRDDKVIAGWNGLMIRTLADAGRAFGEPRYLAMAAHAAEAVWSRHWDGARLSRIWAAGQARSHAALEDYAWAGLGFLALFDATGEVVWRDRAAVLVRAMVERFGDADGRLQMAASGPLGPVYDSADGAVPSGESSALELMARLARRGDDPEVEARALALRAALSGALADQPLMRPDALLATRILDDGGSGRRQVLARGRVRVHLLADRLVLEIAPGWHVNAHEPGPDWLIGAALDGAAAVWPAGEALRAGFAKDPIQVYTGRLEVPLKDTQTVVTITVQTCSDEICLDPDSATFRLR